MSEKFKVVVDVDLKSLIPKYIENRKMEVIHCRESLKNQKYKEISNIGHKLKGNARTYGFLMLEELGNNFEIFSAEKNDEKLVQLIDFYEKYLENVEIEYAEI